MELKTKQVGRCTVYEGTDGRWSGASYGRPSHDVFESMLQGEASPGEYFDALHREASDKEKVQEMLGTPARGPLGRLLLRWRLRAATDEPEGLAREGGASELDSPVNDATSNDAPAPHTTYPEDAVDVSDALAGLDGCETHGVRDAFNALRGIERGLPIVINRGSINHEYILTKRGKLGLDGRVSSWFFAGELMDIPKLIVAMPSYRDYIVSRTASYIYAKSDELAELEIKDQDERDAVHRLAGDLATSQARLREDLERKRVLSG